MRELSKYFHTVSYGDTVPDCDVQVIVKFQPRAHLSEQVKAGRALIYCPVDVFCRPEDITTSGAMLCRYNRIIVHCERLRPYFEPYAKVEYLDHHVKYVVSEPRPFQTEGFILWVGWQSMLPVLVDWVNRHPLPLPLKILATPEPGTELLSASQLRFATPNQVTIEPWSPQRQLDLTAQAKAALDIKGTDFHQQHKPATKAVDFIASGIPTAVNQGSSVAEQLTRLGFEVACPEDTDWWLSREYWQETNRFAALLREMLSLQPMGVRYKRIIEEVAREKGFTE